MTTEVLSPAQGAFVSLSEHCVACVDCRPDPDRPKVKAKCAEAAELYRVWFDLWAVEVRR